MNGYNKINKHYKQLLIIFIPIIQNFQDMFVICFICFMKDFTQALMEMDEWEDYFLLKIYNLKNFSH